MRKRTTPYKITDVIIKFCEDTVSSVKPMYIPVRAVTGSEQNECFINVQKVVEKYGGKQVNGWAIWQWANILVEAEAHSIWESPEGQLVDITPHVYGEKEILFLRDDSMVYRGKTIVSKRMPLTHSPLAAEYIELMNERDRLISEAVGKTYAMPVQMAARIAMIEAMANETVKGNEFCPCQSGLKYKKCCGKEE